MKKFLMSLMAIIMIILFLAAAAGIFFYKKYVPTKELADQNEWFGVIGDRVAIILNNERVENIKGRYLDGELYLPLNWVNETLNERFYWDEGEQLLIYTLPNEIVYADVSTLGSSQKPLVVQQENQVWLLAGLVLNYTDIRMERFIDGDVKRVFIDTQWDPIPIANTKKDGKLRVRGGVKSPILTDVAQKEPLEILEPMEQWTKVRTQTGFIGYIQNKLLEESVDQPQVSTFQHPVYTNISMKDPVCLVWHQTFSQQANDAMPQMMANVKGVNVIAPTWFMLTDNKGNYESLADQGYVQEAHNMGLQVWAVLDNFNKGDNVQSEILFASTTARKKLIASLIKDAKTYGLDGINLDVEGIKEQAGPHYVQFIRELSVHCRNEGLVLSVDNTVPAAYSAFYNREEQGRVVDYVVIMAYDEHHVGGEAGSVASLGYVTKGVEDTLAMIPKEKVIVGIPFYTRLWETDGETLNATSMGIATAKKWVEQNGMELKWQEETGQYYGELEKDGKTYRLWMEEEASLRAKMDVAREKNLAGVACWKLGFETKELWDIVRLK
ncbi:MAG: glycoside hydrolase [Lachnospiraceae bacterium]|nr:glycoside hydrolase [Lachnospiraceae bacterium]MCI9183452.1 glycoside hydrolase [Lachnospiraceae bacterium]